MKGPFVAIQLNSQTKSPEGNWFIQDGKLKNEKPSPSAGGLGGRQAKCPLCSALGREADAKTDDLKKLVGHTAGSKTTAHVYDRDRIEAHRRIAKARKAKRDAQ